MVFKSSYGFEEKKIVRSKLKNFISSHYSRAQLKNAKILTLLGHEDWEIKQIWGPLGVPLKNITSFERTNKSYELSKANNPDIRIIKGDITEFLYDTDEQFDIINLDYQGHFTEYTRQMIKTIACNETLGQKGILATWFSTNRENYETQGRYAITTAALNGKQGELSTRRSALDNRSDAISSQIIVPFIDGQTNFFPHQLVELLGLEKDYWNNITQSQEFQLMNKRILQIINSHDKETIRQTERLYPGLIEAYKSIRISAIERITDSDRQRHIETISETLHKTVGYGYIQNLLFQQLQAQRFTHDDLKIKYPNVTSNAVSLLSNIITDVLYYQNIGAYFSTDTQRLKYNSGAYDMFVDFNHFNQINYKNTFNVETNKTSNESKFKINNLHKITSSKTTQKLKEIESYRNKCKGVLPKREEIKLDYTPNE